MEFNRLYEDLIHPKELVKHIKCFVSWVSLGKLDDLEYCLKAFEDEEMYEHCEIILKQINKLKNERILGSK